MKCLKWMARHAQITFLLLTLSLSINLKTSGCGVPIIDLQFIQKASADYAMDVYYDITSVLNFTEKSESSFNSLVELEDKDFAVRRTNGDAIIEIRFADFNEDGIRDSVICKRNAQTLEILSGKDNSQIFFWQDNEPKENKIKDSYFNACEIVYLIPDHPSVVIGSSGTYNNTSNRGTVPQFVAFNNGQGIQVQQVYANYTYSGKQQNAPLKVATRGVQCVTLYNTNLANGSTYESLCFYAGYDGPLDLIGVLPGNPYGTATTLIKFRANQNGLTAEDVTAATGLYWDGMMGTSMYDSRYHYSMSGCNKGSYQNFYMMDGAWNDYNDDGYPDLFTVAQHGELLSFTMKPSSNAHGFVFTKNRITKAEEGPTEFLTVRSLDKFEPSLNINCLSVTGEGSGNKCGDVPDQLYCYENGKWAKVDLPIENMTSETSGTVLRASGEGELIMQGLKNGVDKYFSFPFSGNEVIGEAQVFTYGQDYVVSGYACIPNRAEKLEITLSSNDINNSSRKEYSTELETKSLLNLEAQLKCMQPDATAQAFNLALSSFDLENNQVYVYASNSLGEPKLITVLDVSSANQEFTGDVDSYVNFVPVISFLTNF